jgi:hypothetical protein
VPYGADPAEEKRKKENENKEINLSIFSKENKKDPAKRIRRVLDILLADGRRVPAAGALNELLQIRWPNAGVAAASSSADGHPSAAHRL